MRRKSQNPLIEKQWFKEQLEARELSVRQLSTHLGVSPTMTSLMLRGISKVPHDKAETMAALFGVQISEIYKRLGTQIHDEYRTITVTDYLDVDFKVRPLGQDDMFTLQAPFDVRNSGFGIQIRTGNMYDGWVVVASGLRQPAPELLNRLCLYENPEQDRHVAFIKNGYKPDTYTAQSAIMGGKTVENIEVEWAMEIMWIKPRN